MKVLTKIQNWGDHHHPKWLDFFRIALGAVLMWKGIAFLTHLSTLTTYLIQSGLDDSIGSMATISLIAHLIIALHLIGGLCIAVGAHTRLFSLLNLPILLVAVFYVDLQHSLFTPYADRWLAAIVTLGLICFMIEGDGVLLIDHAEHTVAA